MRNSLRTLAAMTLLALAAASVSAGAQDWGTRIEFQSYSSDTMYALARTRRDEWKPVKVWGFLKLPPGIPAADAVPAMVLAHGSAGVGPELLQWIVAFNEIGVATFVVDTYGPRGVRNTMADQAQLNTSANLFDAFFALETLAQTPRIDPARIGIMGFSRGGEVAFRTAIDPLRAAVLKSELKFALHIPVYAGCNQIYWSRAITRAPILNLLGGADDYTTAEPCRRLAARYEQAGADVTTIEYPNAPHAWDSLGQLVYVPTIISGSSCGVVRWDISGWEITEERTGRPIRSEQVAAHLQACSKRGAHVGRDAGAFVRSRADAQAFVRRHFFPGR